MHVERPVACSGKGQYMALVYYGSQGGAMRQQVFKYSHKDPRQMGEAHVLCGIARMIPARYRPFIVAISVVKRCLHPISPDVAKIDRESHSERVFTWIVEHENTAWQSSQQFQEYRLEEILKGNTVQRIVLPYTLHELRELPITQVITTNYWGKMFASISLRGIERPVPLSSIVVS